MTAAEALSEMDRYAFEIDGTRCVPAKITVDGFTFRRWLAALRTHQPVEEQAGGKDGLTEADPVGHYFAWSGPLKTDLVLRWDGKRLFYEDGNPVGNRYANFRGPLVPQSAITAATAKLTAERDSAQKRFEIVSRLSANRGVLLSEYFDSVLAAGIDAKFSDGDPDPENDNSAPDKLLAWVKSQSAATASLTAKVELLEGERDAAVAEIQAADEMEKRMLAMMEENEQLKLRLLSAAGDDLCRLTQEEIKAYSSGAVKIPPKEEFIASCERFHSQIAKESGVLENCLTLAQLIAENQSIKDELAHMRTSEAIQDRDALRQNVAGLESQLAAKGEAELLLPDGEGWWWEWDGEAWIAYVCRMQFDKMHWWWEGVGWKPCSPGRWIRCNPPGSSPSPARPTGEEVLRGLIQKPA